MIITCAFQSLQVSDVGDRERGGVRVDGGQPGHVAVAGQLVAGQGELWVAYKVEVWSLFLLFGLNVDFRSFLCSVINVRAFRISPSPSQCENVFAVCTFKTVTRCFVCWKR